MIMTFWGFDLINFGLEIMNMLIVISEIFLPLAVWQPHYTGPEQPSNIRRSCHVAGKLVARHIPQLLQCG